MTGSRLAAGLLAAGAIAACSIEVDLDRKSCPCVDGYLCDSIESVCVEDACAVSAKQLAVLWQTPHTLAFSWGPTGEEAKFLLYELVIAETEQDLASRSGTARVLTDADTPELAAFSPGNGRAMVVMVGGLPANTIHYAELFATDTDGCQSRSGAKPSRTLPERTNDPIVLFDAWEAGDPTPGVQPSVAEITGTGTAAEVTYDLSSDVENCFFDDARSECGQPLKIDLDVGVVGAEGGQENRVRPETFDEAYLELRLRYESPVPAKWANVWLDTTGGAGDFRFGDFMIPASADYRTIEIPLHLLQQDGVPLGHANLLNEPLTQFGISAQWHRDSVVHVDAIRIRH